MRSFWSPGAEKDLAEQRGMPTPKGLQSNLRLFCLGNRNIVWLEYARLHVEVHQDAEPSGCKWRHQVAEEGRSFVIICRCNLALVLLTWSDFVLFRRLQGHGSIVVGDSLSTQRMTNYPRIKEGTIAMWLCGGLRHHWCTSDKRRHETRAKSSPLIVHMSTGPLDHVVIVPSLLPPTRDLALVINSTVILKEASTEHCWAMKL
jgi:hypothetical protein